MPSETQSYILVDHSKLLINFRLIEINRTRTQRISFAYTVKMTGPLERVAEVSKKYALLRIQKPTVQYQIGGIYFIRLLQLRRHAAIDRLSSAHGEIDQSPLVYSQQQLQSFYETVLPVRRRKIGKWESTYSELANKERCKPSRVGNVKYEQPVLKLIPMYRVRQFLHLLNVRTIFSNYKSKWSPPNID